MKGIETKRGKLIYLEEDAERGIRILLILTGLAIMLIMYVLGVYTFMINSSRKIFSVSTVLFTIILLALGVFVLRAIYIVIVEVSLSVFRIYENGFVLHRRPLKYWLLRKEVYVPFKDIAKVYVGLRGYETTPHSDLKLEPAHINYLMIETRNGKIYGINHRDWGNIKKESLMKLIETLKEKGIVIERNETHSIQSN